MSIFLIFTGFFTGSEPRFHNLCAVAGKKITSSALPPVTFSDFPALNDKEPQGKRKKQEFEMKTETYKKGMTTFLKFTVIPIIFALKTIIFAVGKNGWF